MQNRDTKTEKSKQRHQNRDIKTETPKQRHQNRDTKIKTSKQRQSLRDYKPLQTKQSTQLHKTLTSLDELGQIKPAMVDNGTKQNNKAHKTIIADRRALLSQYLHS